jgi:hypothetical protein
MIDAVWIIYPELGFYPCNLDTLRGGQILTVYYSLEFDLVILSQDSAPEVLDDVSLLNNEGVRMLGI